MMILNYVLTVELAKPVISANPSGPIVSPGTSVTLTCSSNDNFADLEYDFFKNGQLYHYSKDPAFDLPGDAVHSGIYTCQVIIPGGSVKSEKSNEIEIRFEGLSFVKC